MQENWMFMFLSSIADLKVSETDNLIFLHQYLKSSKALLVKVFGNCVNCVKRESEYLLYILLPFLAHLSCAQDEL